MTPNLKSIALACAIALSFVTSAFAADIEIIDPYARSSGPTAKSGAAFLIIKNTTDTADRLIAASSDAAKKVQLHGHFETGDGIMQMREVEDGIEIPAQGEVVLKRGGLHVMFMGLTGPFIDGEMLEIVLTFEHAGDITVTIPVDINR